MKAVFTSGAERDLRRLGHSVASRIVAKIIWLADNWNDTVPQPLSGSHKGFYKLRVGDWRVIYSIDYKCEQLIIEVVDHRSKIYKSK